VIAQRFEDGDNLTPYSCGGRMILDDLVEKYQDAPDPPALAGLGDVDWASVSHVYGPATDFPALLRAAVGEDSDDRQFGLRLLFETICHQGTVGSATSQAVPFLYRALEADETPDKQSLAYLLATIADCQTGAKEHMADSRRAVGERLDLLYPYLRDDEPGVRRSVAVALGYYPEIVARLLPDLEAALRDEENQSAREALQVVIEHSSRCC
jgi:hypothetical protein